jgi:hypothetical protein
MEGFVLACHEMAPQSFELGDFAALLARTCAELSAGGEVGVVLQVEPTGPPISAGSTAHAAEVEALGLRTGEGAAVCCLRTGVASVYADLASCPGWPRYSRGARAAGFVTVSTFALVTGTAPVGVVNVFAPTGAAPPDVDALRSLAKVAATQLDHLLALDSARTRVDQLQRALDSRIVIEQAKGMVAQYRAVAPDVAFHALRSHARSHGRGLTEVCRAIARGELEVGDVAVEFSAMNATRRHELRATAIARWTKAVAESRDHASRAAAAASRSAELRVELAHHRALRNTEALGRSIDRHFREARAERPDVGLRPTVVVGDDRDDTRSFVQRVLADTKRLDVIAATSSSAETLACVIVEQPDLLVVGPDLQIPSGAQFTAELRRYCPDSRILMVFEHDPDVDRIQRCGANAVVALGDEAALEARALELCGVRGIR